MCASWAQPRQPGSAASFPSPLGCANAIPTRACLAGSRHLRPPPPATAPLPSPQPPNYPRLAASPDFEVRDGVHASRVGQWLRVTAVRSLMRCHGRWNNDPELTWSAAARALLAELRVVVVPITQYMAETVCPPLPSPSLPCPPRPSPALPITPARPHPKCTLASLTLPAGALTRLRSARQRVNRNLACSRD